MERGKKVRSAGSGPPDGSNRSVYSGNVLCRYWHNMFDAFTITVYHHMAGVLLCAVIQLHLNCAELSTNCPQK